MALGRTIRLRAGVVALTLTLLSLPARGLSGGLATPVRITLSIALDGSLGNEPMYLLHTCCPDRSWPHPVYDVSDSAAKATWEVTSGTVYFAQAIRCPRVDGIYECSSTGPAAIFGDSATRLSEMRMIWGVLWGAIAVIVIGRQLRGQRC